MRASVAILIVQLLAVGCGSDVDPVGSPRPTSTAPNPSTGSAAVISPIPTRSAGPPVPPSPARPLATLSVTGSGPVLSTQPPLGIRPVFTIQQAIWDWSANWIPTEDDARFQLVSPPLGSTEPFRVAGDAIGAPSTLSPGRYWVAAGVGLVSDMVSPGFEPGLVGTSFSCFQYLTIEPSARRVSIQVTFGRNRCRIGVEQG